MFIRGVWCWDVRARRGGGQVWAVGEWHGVLAPNELSWVGPEVMVDGPSPPSLSCLPPSLSPTCTHTHRDPLHQSTTQNAINKAITAPLLQTLTDHRDCHTACHPPNHTTIYSFICSLFQCFQTPRWQANDLRLTANTRPLPPFTHSSVSPASQPVSRWFPPRHGTLGNKVRGHKVVI